MAYIYEVSFILDHDQLEELSIGRSLEKVIGYLRTLLPAQPGFMTAQAFYEVQAKAKPRIFFSSEWENWEDCQSHLNSSLLEDKILLELDPHIQSEHLEKRIYQEVV